VTFDETEPVFWPVPEEPLPPEAAEDLTAALFAWAAAVVAELDRRPTCQDPGV
jgi:hypothetical protein